ncbi:MAG: monovalent cation/H(+) antiporter subunit G [Pseudomonadota bacterium]
MNLELFLDILGWTLCLVGGFFVVVGAIGIVRFPDFYTRLHAAGVTDTFGAELIIFGMMTQSDDWLTVVKLFIIALFLFITSPTSTHAVAYSAWTAGLRPLEGVWKAKRDGGDENG